MSAPKRVLIVTSGNLCRNPRPAKEAATLARAGFAVTVLRPSEGDAYDRQDAVMAAAQGYREDILPGPAGPGARLARRLRRWLAVRAVALGLEDPAALGAARQLLARARALPAELTIVHNEISLWAGLRLLRTGRRVAADIEDWHSEDLRPTERRHRPLRLLREIERGLMGEAAYVTTTSAALAGALHQRYGGRRPTVITNSFPLQAAPRTARAGGGTPRSFLWFSQTVGPGRGLEAFCDFWPKLTTPSRLVLLGEPRPGYADHLRSRLPPAHRGNLEFIGLVPPADLPDMIARHDLGLALEVGTIPSRDLTITNKALQYLNAGLPLVATDTAGQREVLQAAPDAGVILGAGNCPAPPDLLEAWLREPSQLHRAQQAARSAAERIYCWEVEAPKFLAAVHQALIPG